MPDGKSLLEMFADALQAAHEQGTKALARDLIRDGRGLPTVEQEMGWRVMWRGQGGLDGKVGNRGD